MSLPTYTEGPLRAAVAASRSYAETLRRLGLRPAGGNYLTLRRKLAEAGISTGHFTGQGWARGQQVPARTGRTLDQLLVNDLLVNSDRLRRRLLREGRKDHRCESCGGTEWLGQAIPLELEHANGDRLDNRLENLRLLCPNCHALTPTYRGRNIRRIKAVR